MSTKRDAMRQEILRRRIRFLLGLGWGVAKIARDVGKSYAVVKMMAGQETREMRNPEQPQ